eukprot:scaffold18839_cov61-Cyclotella_meneghiniana.AAC.11
MEKINTHVVNIASWIRIDNNGSPLTSPYNIEKLCELCTTIAIATLSCAQSYPPRKKRTVSHSASPTLVLFSPIVEILTGLLESWK